MIKPEFSKMSWPEGLGLDILKEYLSDKEMEKLISDYSMLPRRQRRIILPSRICVRKIYLHFVFNQIQSGGVKWSELRKEIRDSFGTLGFARTTFWQIKQAWFQREREIAKESK